MKLASRHERNFSLLWLSLGGPRLEPEYRFCKTRKWRSDFAHVESRTLLELDGGIWIHGGHSRGSGMVKDAEKNLEAILAGWRVIRLVPSQICSVTIARIITLITQ